jgi:uncharacterized protein YndB with AHSA1/START domain
MEASQWSKFKLRVNVNTTVQEAYNHWVTPAGLEKWFLREARFKDKHGKEKAKDSLLEAGDTYEWLWFGYPDSVMEKGQVLKANGTDQFAFTFSLGCPVTISIYTEADETIIQLVESSLPTDEETAMKHYVGDSKGWIFYLANLKSVLEGGLDLRNKKEELKDVITA